MIKLYDYYRSSASYRVRIALALKEVAYETVSVDLLKGEHKQDAYKAINPAGTVPYFIHHDVAIGQSLATLEYLDDAYPGPLLVYGTPAQKALIRELSLIIACDIHPLNNPKVWKGYVGGIFKADEQQMQDWYHRWIHDGFKTYEATLKNSGYKGGYSCGAKPSMADLCLMPQIYNARRFDVDLSAYEAIRQVEEICVSHPAFIAAAPESHKDAPDDMPPIHGAHSPLLKRVA